MVKDVDIDGYEYERHARIYLHNGGCQCGVLSPDCWYEPTEALRQLAEDWQESEEQALKDLTEGWLDQETCEETNNEIHTDVTDAEWLALYLKKSKHDIIIG
jgi:hypothetical protein